MRRKQNGTSAHQATFHQNRFNQTPGDWDDGIPIPKLRFFQAAALVFFLSIICFFNSYDGDFVFDDSEAIQDNKDLLPESPVGDLFVHDFWGDKLDSKNSHKSYRPLTVLTFRWNYYLAGGLHPTGFHVVNILLHGLVSSLVLYILSALYRQGLISTFQDHVSKSALLCSILFAVHPVHTESVAAVVGRADLLCAVTFLLSLLCYMKSFQTGAGRFDIRPDSFKLIWILLSVLLVAVAVLCKEQGITVIGICSAFDVIVVCKIDLLKLLHLKKDTGVRNENVKPVSEVESCCSSDSESSDGSSQKVSFQSSWLKSLVIRHLILLFSGLLILYGRFTVMGSKPPTFQKEDNPHSFQNNTFIRALNYNYLYSINLWLLLNPWWLCFDWSMGCVPVISSFIDFRVFAVITMWLFFFGLLITSYRKYSSSQRLLIMSSAFLVIPFLPASNIFFRVGFVVAERILYLPSIGFCMLVVYGVKELCDIPRLKQVMAVFITYLILLFMLRSMQRSYEWREEITLFSTGAKVCPLNAKVQYNIAKLQQDLGNTEYAISKYRLSLRLHPKYDQAMNNLGNILKDRGKIIEAEQLLETAVEIRPEFAAAWMNLGIVQAALGKNLSAERSYFTAMTHRRKYPDCLYNLGNLYLDHQRTDDALNAWKNATLQKLTHINAWSNMMILLENLGRSKDAVHVAREALKFLPTHSIIHFNMANSLGKLGRNVESEKAFLTAIKIDGNISKYHANLGVLYHRWGRHDDAEKFYLNALKLDPHSQFTEKNLNMLRRKLGKDV